MMVDGSLRIRGRSPRRLIAALSLLGLLAITAPSPASTAVAATNAVVTENQQPGSSSWQLGSLVANDPSGQIKGYASATSASPGDSLTLYVTVNPAQTFNIDVYRVGWYGGTGGRLMQQVGPLNGATQTFPCPMDSTTGMISCNWSASYSLTVPTTWTDGIYLARLSNANGY